MNDYSKIDIAYAELDTFFESGNLIDDNKNSLKQANKEIYEFMKQSFKSYKFTDNNIGKRMITTAICNAIKTSNVVKLPILGYYIRQISDFEINKNYVKEHIQILKTSKCYMNDSIVLQIKAKIL